MQYASVLLFNAVVLTLDGNDAVASALALDGDRILAVGDRDGWIRSSGRTRNAGTWGALPCSPAFTTPTGIF